VIGIGSSNKYDFRNPFTAEETIEMLGLHLSKQFSNYSFLCIPDFGHIPQFRDGSKWVGEVAKAFGKLDAFVTGNEYVANLLEGHYAVIAGQDIIPKEKWAMMCGTMVRTAMAQGTDLRHMMPSSVADYLESKKLVERFRREFGLETLAAMAGQDIYRRDADAEHFRIASAVE
ncbi:MAG TPA: hypothetical protein VI934_01840, partial [Candidatus Nanoarchaeia archaeon]|nr:hypothetical protein [Candidatus Nanoarchaeia archaeon]